MLTTFSYISGVTVLGTPAEIYNYGAQYCLIVVPIFLMGFIVSYVYLPVFCSLKVGSSYEYLELRFNSAVRTFASVMFVVDEVRDVRKKRKKFKQTKDLNQIFKRFNFFLRNC